MDAPALPFSNCLPINPLPSMRRRYLSRFLSLLFVALAVLTAGCSHKQLTPAEVRAITREMVFAAKNATAGKAEVGMRPEIPPADRTARGEHPPATDHVYITLAPGRSGQTDAETLSRLEIGLDRVARQHDLERENRSGAPGLVRFDYRHGALRTQAIHIITPLGNLSPGVAGTHAPKGRLAIIIDDLGYDRSAADALFALPFPLTVSVLPHHPHSSDIAEEAHRRGYQVMLHLPMESTNGEAKPEAIELRTGMSPAEATRLLDGMLETVPYAAGANNHQGSLATADARLMAAIMPALHERGMFFIDSRTTRATLAYDAAVRAGVPAASRKVFLDDTPTREAVRLQIAQAAKGARKQGAAIIAIGHPYPATLQALQDELPRLKAQGIGLVFASQLAR